jgi:hypothetical protein
LDLVHLYWSIAAGNGAFIARVEVESLAGDEFPDDQGGEDFAPGRRGTDLGGDFH